MRNTITFLLVFILGTNQFFAQEEGFEFINPPVTIVVLGSSTAAGAGTWPIDNAWVNLFRCYAQEFNPNNQVINLAKGGYNTYHLLPTDTEPTPKRRTPDTLRNFTKALEFKPDGIIVNLPSNDISNGYSVEEQLENFRLYQEFCDSNQIELWVTTTQARNFPKVRKRLLQRDLKDSLHAMFPNHCIDFWTGLSDDNFNVPKEYDSGDGCHLNNDGHKILTDRVIESQAFCWEFNETSFQRTIPNENQEELPPYLLEIGFKGSIESNSTLINKSRFIRIIQEDRVLNAEEVSVAKYDLKTIVDLRLPVKVEYSAPNSLTKVVEFNYDQMVKSVDKPSNYYPIETLDMREVPLEQLNHRFPKTSFTIAKFNYDSTSLSVKLDQKHASFQRQRIIDASIIPPAEGKKQVTYWENGKKKSVLKFRKGQLHKTSKWFSENGKRERIVCFRNGAYHGKYIVYTKKGKKSTLYIFNNDMQVGAIKTFD